LEFKLIFWLWCLVLKPDTIKKVKGMGISSFSLEGEGRDEGDLIGIFPYLDFPSPNPLPLERA